MTSIDINQTKAPVMTNQERDDHEDEFKYRIELRAVMIEAKAEQVRAAEKELRRLLEELAELEESEE